MGKKVPWNTNLFPYHLAFASKLSVILLCLGISAFSRFVYTEPKLQGCVTMFREGVPELTVILI